MLFLGKSEGHGVGAGLKQRTHLIVQKHKGKRKDLRSHNSLKAILLGQEGPQEAEGRTSFTQAFCTFNFQTVVSLFLRQHNLPQEDKSVLTQLFQAAQADSMCKTLEGT